MRAYRSRDQAKAEAAKINATGLLEQWEFATVEEFELVARETSAANTKRIMAETAATFAPAIKSLASK